MVTAWPGMGAWDMSRPLLMYVWLVVGYFKMLEDRQARGVDTVLTDGYVHWDWVYESTCVAVGELVVRCEEQCWIAMKVEGMTGQQLVITKLSNNEE
jgi:hypothetical protein